MAAQQPFTALPAAQGSVARPFSSGKGVSASSRIASRSSFLWKSGRAIVLPFSRQLRQARMPTADMSAPR